MWPFENIWHIFDTYLKISSSLIHFWRFSPFFRAKRRTTYSNWFEKKAAAQGLKWVDWMMTTRMHSGKCRCLILNFNANAVCMKFNALDLVSSKFCLTKYKTKRTKKKHNLWRRHLRLSPSPSHFRLTRCRTMYSSWGVFNEDPACL